jgi:nucleoside-diphosphate-sugar epimerase
MLTSRRSFLRWSAACGGALSVMKPLPMMATQRRAERQMRILILGGTGFIGPHQVRYALQRGHTVTLFNRGQTNPDLFPDVERLLGDRDNDLDALRGREWDVVIDNSASRPRWVRQSAQLLKDSAELYLFVSTISVYADNSIVNMDEDGPLLVLENPTPEALEDVRTNYGPLKALCEAEARAAFPGRATVVRPGLIVGPGDPTDRFTYWPVRINRGGEVLAPGDPTDPVQFIDARDLSEWMIRMAESRTTGTYNATGPASRLSIAETLYGIRGVTTAAVRFTWAAFEFLQQQQVRPWRDMPLWIPPRDGMQGFSTVNCSRAVEAGLTFRPLAVTARDTLDWHASLPAERRQLRWGIDAQREVEVLAAWHANRQ